MGGVVFVFSPAIYCGVIPATSAAAGLVGLPLDELEKQAITDILAKTKGNREKSAKILGIGERTLYRKIKEYKI